MSAPRQSFLSVSRLGSVVVSFLSVFILLAGQVGATPAQVMLFTLNKKNEQDSLPFAVDALTSRGPAANINFTETADAGYFEDDKLDDFDAVVFLLTSGVVLDQDGRRAFRRWLDKGGNFVGVAEAAATLPATDFYLKTVGAYIDEWSVTDDYVLDVAPIGHPSTSMLPLSEWKVNDTIVSFQSDPRMFGAQVLLSIDPLKNHNKTIPENARQGSSHPISWFQEQGAGVSPGGTAGRSFYTSLGYRPEQWQDDTFVAHVMGGITWALDSGATKATNHSANVGAGVERSAAVPKSSIYSMGFLSLLCTSLFIAVYHL